MLRDADPNYFTDIYIVCGYIPSYRRSKATGKQEADLEGLPSRVFEHRLSEKELALKFPHGYKQHQKQ